MAKVNQSLMEQTGTIGDRVFYTRFGKQFSRSRAKSFTDNKSGAQLRQRALFKAMQHTSSLLGTVIQRGLAKVAHAHRHVENNEFASINKQFFTYDNGTVHIDYPHLLLSDGPVAPVRFTGISADGLHVELQFDPCNTADYASPDDVVFIYAVEFQVEVCQLVACVERQAGRVAFDLPDLSDEINNSSPKLGEVPQRGGGVCTFHLYAIVETANTACMPTLSPDEKKADKNHRNINRRVSPSTFIGSITVGSAN